MAIPNKLVTFFFTLFIVILTVPTISAEPNTTGPPAECTRPVGGCHNKSYALKLKIVAIFAILITSMIGICLPIITRAVPALSPDRNLFVVVKAFASGVILATGYMHVLPDSLDALKSECLPDKPWHAYPFTTLVAMFSAVLTLMVDSFAMSFFKKHYCKELEQQKTTKVNNENVELQSAIPHSCHGGALKEFDSTLLRCRVVAQVLELGIIVHSVIIGLSLGASDNPCTIRPLVAALCFHQMFEGMGLGGCILQANYRAKTNAMMVFFFSATTPFGIMLGIGLSSVYTDNSPAALIVVGLLDAASAGLLNYMALVDLLAPDFMGDKLQGDMKLQVWCYVAVVLGAGGMSVMAIWA
ncbi:fe(2+) transport protein 1-like [Heracleum sosnowskyi]|uniref:Fe(2+) transport protein 1-like n=1 Tax=Heracleum sosnowskyi TaxID=360622 RepID=A0AAD8HYA1_9APIA|nr:fe(2+) transport protein 1-like [Heracleum sosnowskyi]